MNTKLKNLMTLAAGSVAAVTVAGVAEASSLVTLNFFETDFSDGGDLTGTFVYDPSTMTFPDYDFVAGVGSAVTSSFNYLPTNSTITAESDTTLTISADGLTRTISFVFLDSLDTLTTIGSESTIQPSSSPFLSPSNEFSDPGGGTQLRGITGGTVVVQDIDDDHPVLVPEPGTLLGLGLFGLAGVAGRRLKK